MRLSKDLGVPMYKAVVESAEFAHNFSMTEPPIMYIQKLDLDLMVGVVLNIWITGKCVASFMTKYRKRRRSVNCLNMEERTCQRTY